ncbi:MAG: silent information regulator protein Sir2, partial [Lachnospirales bacterium]
MKKGLKRFLSKALAVCMTVSSLSMLQIATPIQTMAASSIAVSESGGWMESCYVEWTGGSSSYKSYNAYVKKSSDSSWTKLDDALIRRYSSNWRADAVGLAAGSYDMKVVPVDSSGEVTADAITSTGITVTNYDRSGAAFSPSSTYKGAGAYNSDGTLKSGAKVIYVTPDTAKTVTATIGGVSYTGFQNIVYGLQKGTETAPIDIRIVGMIKADNMDSFLSSAEGLQVKGKNSYSNLNLTIEGIGEDSGIHGFGMLLRNCSNVELRNFAVMNCMDDSISLDTDNSNVWVHNLDLFYGQTGSAADQVKGDGTVDLKADSTYVTISNNHFFDNGKSSLCGMKSESTSSYITYHHNWFDHSDSRHPRIRTMSVHIYNNYFDGCSKYGVGTTMGSSAFVEANYFRNTKYPMMSSGQGSDALGSGTFSGETGGMIKSYNNTIVGGNGYYTQNSPASTGYDAYEVTSRTATVPSSATTVSGGTSYNNFDTGATSYDINVAASAVDDPANVPSVVMATAGRVNGGDFKYTFDNSTEDTNYGVISDLKTKVENYSSPIVSIGGAIDGSGIVTETTTSSSETPTETTTSSSVEESSEATTTVIDESAMTHNFTLNGTTSSFYKINGSLSTNYGTVTYNNLTLTQCLKMESSTYIDFSPEVDGTLIVVTNPAYSGTIELDENVITIGSDGVATLDVTGGVTHELSKGSGSNYVFYIAFVPKTSEETTVTETTTETTTTTTTEATETTTQSSSGGDTPSGDNVIN